VTVGGVSSHTLLTTTSLNMTGGSVFMTAVPATRTHPEFA